MSLKTLLGRSPKDYVVRLPEMDLLTVEEVYAVPGVMQTGNLSLPTPFMDFRKLAKRDRRQLLKHVYWLRGDILRWLESLRRRRIIR